MILQPYSKTKSFFRDFKLAKKAVFVYVSIDSVAGPSEIMVLADETANPRFVAADLLSQAEHDEMASAILVTTSEELAGQVSKEVDGFVAVLIGCIKHA